ncbi:septal ring lytic transglycosylase RlpA family protein [Waterburya agarophytonicola K14]|uniref:Probable endolytic peptidoglycan transglycosylase RlpA n=1 Tax=Waterburya agarophytonicola KI4 TaxID=2874699 RepID=A0A964BNK3_9CYAN|nr:septal ring lytic transglycosylase RlpA family protein [Waterburya agarophytonicola]MCC0176535.1 septal ring lytic transglycosylase RlpA family protein [Waterburya agarophytonicola KI4]
MQNIFLKNSNFLIFSALLSVLNLTLLTSWAQAKPTKKVLKVNQKISALKLRDRQSLDLHLTLSRSITPTTDSAIFEQQNVFKPSESDSIIPSADRPLIARNFGGQASWYGPGFHGRRTASGATYNQNAMTAAHRKLRFGTKVRVTNLNNGRSVVVKINDRGPYAKDRVLDVSAAAARSLGMIESGVAPVQVTILGR